MGRDRGKVQGGGGGGGGEERERERECLMMGKNANVKIYEARTI